MNNRVEISVYKRDKSARMLKSEYRCKNKVDFILLFVGFSFFFFLSVISALNSSNSKINKFCPNSTVKNKDKIIVTPCEFKYDKKCPLGHTKFADRCDNCARRNSTRWRCTTKKPTFFRLKKKLGRLCGHRGFSNLLISCFF